MDKIKGQTVTSQGFSSLVQREKERERKRRERGEKEKKSTSLHKKGNQKHCNKAK